MNLGRMIHYMTVQLPTGRANSYGEIAEEFIDGFPVWASLEPLTDAERLKAATVQRATTHRIGTHYDPAITNECRLTYDGRVFDIVSIIDPDERHVELVIVANEVANG